MEISLELLMKELPLTGRLLILFFPAIAILTCALWARALKSSGGKTWGKDTIYHRFISRKPYHVLLKDIDKNINYGNQTSVSRAENGLLSMALMLHSILWLLLLFMLETIAKFNIGVFSLILLGLFSPPYILIRKNKKKEEFVKKIAK